MTSKLSLDSKTLDLKSLQNVYSGVLFLRHSWDRNVPFQTPRQTHLWIRVFKKLLREGIL